MKPIIDEDTSPNEVKSVTKNLFAAFLPMGVGLVLFGISCINTGGTDLGGSINFLGNVWGYVYGGLGVFLILWCLGILIPLYFLMRKREKEIKKYGPGYETVYRKYLRKEISAGEAKTILRELFPDFKRG